ncbi:MAG: hypothetical protein K8R39_00235 [Arcobacteraceae bacterium]|nr:hypothetical protein [Arcobacteraceae bacterium]
MTRLMFLIVFIIIIALITIFALDSYTGKSYIFLFFTITSNTLLYFGFRKNAIFFDTFIGIFLWLGFWFKTTMILIFFENRFIEKVGKFDGSGIQFDNALLISAIAFSALILASFIRENYIFKYPTIDIENSSLFKFYILHRIKIIIFYISLFLFIGVTNYYFHIYQRGEISPSDIPFIISGIYKWLLLFGLSTFAALILKYEFSMKRRAIYFVPILTLIESAITNVSLLSRGMILNSSSLGLGLMRYSYINKYKINIKYWLFIIFIMIFVFIVSISFANKLREYSFLQTQQNHTISETFSNINVTKNVGSIFHLIVSRSVGMEGVLAISTQENLGWNIFSEALSEKYDESKTSFYDSFVDSGYVNSKEQNRHILSMPGFIAFFYYPESLLFLFIVLFSIGIIVSLIEVSAYKLGKNNQILSALIAQVIAYRLIHFGYVPAQSYLLFGTIFLNLLMIYSIDKILFVWYKNKDTNVTT